MLTHSDGRPLFLSLSLSVPIYLSLSLSHLRALSGISSVSRPLSQLLCLTPLQGAQCTFQWSLWWICLSEGTQPSAWINAAPAHQECVTVFTRWSPGTKPCDAHPLWFFLLLTCINGPGIYAPVLHSGTRVLQQILLLLPPLVFLYHSQTCCDSYFYCFCRYCCVYKCYSTTASAVPNGQIWLSLGQYW